MVAFVSPDPERLEDAETFHRGVGGAESNVACYLAQLGIQARWTSRVGDDGFGRYVVGEIARQGVDVSDVEVDTTRPTGVYVKDTQAKDTQAKNLQVAGQSTTQHSQPLYYRAGSAASALSEAVLDLPSVRGASLLHISGITAALGASCLRLLRRTLDEPGLGTVSFDVNHRVSLWPTKHEGQRGPDDGDASRVLLDLARRADIVFVGSDEAQALWGVADPWAVRALIAAPQRLVVKQAAEGATLFHAGTCTYWPALDVAVVEPVGAGDAFAAGFLAGVLGGLGDGACLRLGHLTAAAALITRQDVGRLLPASLMVSLLHADSESWAKARITAPVDVPNHIHRGAHVPQQAIHPKQAIHTDSAPAPAAAYSQAVRRGNVLQLAGQGPTDPATGAYVSGGISEQTQQTMANVTAVLDASGASFDDVLMVRAYLTDVDHFAAFNEVYGTFVNEPFPARTTVYVGLPPGMLIEVDVLAVLGTDAETQD